MSMLAEDSTVMTRTKALCEAIVSDPEYRTLMQAVETFLDDDAARMQYKSVHDRGEELNHKQSGGLELSEAEVQAFESAREALLANPVAKRFIEAQNDLQNVQAAVGKYVGMSLELGRVPEAEDFLAAEGCCSEGGCGCRH